MSDLIDRQAAIDKLEEKYMSFGIFREQRAASQCIDVIKHLPSAQPEIDELQKEVDYWHEKCTSYEQTIVRLTESAQPERRFDEWCTDCKEYDQERNCCPRFNHVIRTTLQEGQPERKKGKWIVLDKNNRWFTPHMYQCPFCRHTLDKMGVNAGRGDANYCPNCGAEMEAAEHDH